MKKILWMSRHFPSVSQVKGLKVMFGADCYIKQEGRPFNSAEDIVSRYRAGKYDDMVVVAPLSVLQKLCEEGINPLWAETVEEPDPSRVEFTSRQGKGYRFNRYRRVKRVAVEFFE